jgi:hypothetical protein
MRVKTLTIPEIGFIAGTRMALAAGIALLLADKLAPSRYRATLVSIGAATTIPAAMLLFGHRTRAGIDLPGMSPRAARRSNFGDIRPCSPPLAVSQIARTVEASPRRHQSPRRRRLAPMYRRHPDLRGSPVRAHSTAIRRSSNRIQSKVSASFSV